MKGLLIIERMVLESIAKEKQSIFELLFDTGLNEGILINVLNSLLIKNIITYKDQYYYINKENIEKLKFLTSSNESSFYEIKEIVSSIVSNYFKKNSDTKLRMEKVFLSSEDAYFLNTKLKDLDSFVKSIKKKQKQNNDYIITKNKNILFWGITDYLSIVN